MSEQKRLYLREDVYFEPLFNHWYAWPYLIPPVTAARFLVKNHIRIMKSFIEDHEIHIMASQNRELTGGEFLNCPEERLGDISALVDEAGEKCSDLIRLSESVNELENLLRSHTSGESLEPFYSAVPDVLQGFVELHLDMDHRASYRLVEPLLYRSDFYKTSYQSVSFGMLSRVDDRPFVFSTPRLPDENHLQINTNFNANALDTLFRARQEPVPEEVIEGIFNDNLEMQGGLPYRELFTDSPPYAAWQPLNEELRIQYIGHAGFMLETRDVSILIDPVIASRSEENKDQIISFSELPPVIDYICLTHNHQDHVNIETLLQLRHKTRQVLVPKNNGGSLADPSMKLLLKQLGFNVTEVDDLDEIPVSNGRIVGIPFFGEHGDLNIRSKTAWYVELGGMKCFFGADSSNPDSRLFEKLGGLFPDIDIFAIGMECVGAPFTWLYGALQTQPVSQKIKNSRRLNGSDARQALAMVKAFRAKHVFIYALGMEPWYRYFMGISYDDDSKAIKESQALIDACKKMDVEAEVLFGKKTLLFN